MNMLKSFWRDEEGVTMVEYAVAASAIIIIAVLAFRTLGNNVNTVMTNVAANVK